MSVHCLNRSSGLLAVACAIVCAPAWVHAQPGSGTASLVPSDPVVAGASGTWIIEYLAADSFARPEGGIITVDIPGGWSAPHTGPLLGPGYVEVSSSVLGAVDSVTIAGRTVQVFAGGSPGSQLVAGDRLFVIYGAQPPAGAARVQTAAQPLVPLTVRSTPHATQAPVELTAGSPSLSVIADVASELAWDPSSVSLLAGVELPVQLRMLDAYGNPSSPGADQLLSLTSDSPSFGFASQGTPVQQLVFPADSVAVGISVFDTAIGGPFSFRAADGDGVAPTLAAAQGSAVIEPGMPASLVVSGVVSPLTAGELSPVMVEAVDAYDHRVTGYTGTITFSSTDSRASLPPDYTFEPGDGGVHIFADAVRLFAAGEHTVSAADVAQPGIQGAQEGIAVVAGIAAALEVTGIPDPWVAGVPATVEVRALDAHGNQATDYLGTVHFVASDGHPAVVVPTDYTFTPADQGAHRFQDGVILATAGTSDVLVGDIDEPALAGAQTGIDVAAGPALGAGLEPSGSVPINAGAGRVLTLTVEDAFGNAVAGEPATIAILDPAEGTLVDDPLNPENTTGSPTAQTGVTGAAGTMTALYQAPVAAGAVDTVGAWTAQLPPGAVAPAVMSTTPGGGTELVWVPGTAVVDTAGAVVALSVEVHDSFGNLDSTASTLVRLVADAATTRFSVDGGVSWSSGPADSISMVNGTTGVRLKVRDTTAGTPALDAADTAGFLAGARFDRLTITPAPPAGAIVAVPSPDTLTADGQSTLDVVAGPLTDRYGNVTEGALVTVEALPGSIESVDEDPSPGVQRRAGIDGRVAFTVRAPAAPGDGLVRAFSVEGSAFGSAGVHYAPPLSFAIEGGVLAPVAGAPGDVIAFDAPLRNLGGHAGTLNASTRVRFGDENGIAFEALIAGATEIPGGGLQDVAFQATALPVGLAPGRYTPLLDLRGTDVHGAAFAIDVAAAVGSFSIESIEIQSVLAPAVVSRGQQGAEVQVVVVNLGDGGVTLDEIGLDFSEPAYAVTAVDPPLATPLGPRASRSYTVSVDVDPLAILGPVVIDAHASGRIGAFQVVAPSALSTATWTVVPGAVLEVVDGSLGPQLASRGQTHPSGVVLTNSGGAPVVLDAGVTRLEIAGGDLVAALESAVLIPGGGTVAVEFAALEIPADYPAGTYGAAVSVAGTENGSPFADTLPVADLLTITDPAALVTGALSPTTVSLGQQRSFLLDVANDGGAPMTLIPSTRLEIGGGVLQALLLEETTVPAGGGTATLEFEPVVIDPGLGVGAHAVTLEATVDEHGVRRDLGLPVAASVVAEAPAALEWVAGSLEPARVTSGQQGVALALSIENTGGAGITVGLAGTHLLVSDGVDELRVDFTGAPLVLAAGATAELDFPPADVPPSLAPQAYAPELKIETEEHGLAGGLDVTAPVAEFTVEAPVALRYVAGTLSPVIATPSSPVSFAVELTNEGEADFVPGPGTAFIVASIETQLDVAGSASVIAGGTSGTLRFQEASLAGVISAGQFTPSLSLVGVDSNGVPVAADVSLAPDLLEIVVDGDLRILSTRSLAPNDHRVNRGQAFAVEVSLANQGEETVEQVELTMQGSGLGSAQAVGIAALAGGDTAFAEVPVVAGSGVAVVTLRSVITGGLGAITGVPVNIGAVDDTLAISIEEPALLEPRLRVAAPPGADDGVVSTGQLFDVEVEIANLGAAPVGAGGVVSLTVPPAFGLLGANLQSFVPGEPVTFAVTAPLAVTPAADVIAEITAIPNDLNNDQRAAVTQTSTALAFTTVEHARLRLDAAFVAPENVVDDGRAFPGQTFTVAGLVQNVGEAGTSGLTTVGISLDPELMLAAGEPEERSTDIGVPVSWQVVAPRSSPAPLALELRVIDAPTDENSGQPAAVSRPVAALSIAVRGAPVTASEAPRENGSPQVARGQANVPAISFTLHHRDLTGSGDVVLLDTLEAEIAGGGGEPRVMAELLSALELRRGSGAGEVLGRWSADQGAGGSPAPASATAAPQSAVIQVLPAFRLAAGTEETLALTFDVAPEAPAGAFVLLLEASTALGARDSASGATFVLELDSTMRSDVFTLFEAPHNFPNPFAAGRESTRLSYVLPADAAVELEIFTLFGDRVWSASYAAGAPGGRSGLNEVVWDGGNTSGELVRNGVYICQVRGGDIDARWKIAVAR